jgi:hypothetical protein
MNCKIKNMRHSNIWNELILMGHSFIIISNIYSSYQVVVSFNLDSIKYKNNFNFYLNLHLYFNYYFWNRNLLFTKMCAKLFEN